MEQWHKTQEDNTMKALIHDGIFHPAGHDTNLLPSEHLAASRSRNRGPPVTEIFDKLFWLLVGQELQYRDGMGQPDHMCNPPQSMISQISVTDTTTVGTPFNGMND